MIIADVEQEVISLCCGASSNALKFIFRKKLNDILLSHY